VGESRSSLFAVVLGLVAGILAAVPATIVLTRSRGPEVTAVTPPRTRPGDTVVLAGSRFETTPEANIVLFGDQTGRVVSAKADELQVEVPQLAVALGGELRLAVRVLAGDRASAPRDVAVYRDRSTAANEPGATASAVPAPQSTVPAAPPASTPAAGGVDLRVPRSLPSTRTASARAVEPQVQPEVRPQVEAPRPAPAAESVPSARREFVFDRTAAESNKRAAGGLAGFDASTVDLKRAPDVAGRIDFEVTPAHVKTGDRYSVKAFLINDGAKPIRIKEMFVATTLNETLSAGPVAPRVREVAPRQRDVIGVFSDTWKAAAASWAMDVTITSDRGDVYKNQVAWK
jgi:hypothetical protein